MDFTDALIRASSLAAILEKGENDPNMDENVRDSFRADRVAVEIMIEWAIKAHSKDEQKGTDILNALHI
jgi:hypothetical protein